MKSGAQIEQTDDGDFEAGFQIMFQKRKIKRYLAANKTNAPVSNLQITNKTLEGMIS